MYIIIFNIKQFYLQDQLIKLTLYTVPTQKKHRLGNRSVFFFLIRIDVNVYGYEYLASKLNFYSEFPILIDVSLKLQGVLLRYLIFAILSNMI